MPFTAQLVVQGETHTVRHFSWAVAQQTDQLGRPDAQVQGGTVAITLDAPPTDLLSAWARSHTKRLDGAIHVFEADSATVRDTLRFFEACCVSLQRGFQNAHAAQGLTMVLSLSANRLQFAELEVHNNWPDGAA